MTFLNNGVGPAEQANKFRKEGKIEMKFVYPCVFKQCEDGHYEGYFPNLEMCTARGNSLDEAIRDAMDAESNWIQVELEEDDPDIPPVSDIEDMKLEEGEFVRNIACNIRFHVGWDE